MASIDEVTKILADVFVTNTDNNVDLVDLVNVLTGATITSATVTLNIFDGETNTLIVGPAFPLAMPHVAGGTYRVTVDETAVVIAGQLIRLVVLAVDGALQRQFVHRLTVKE